MVNRAEADGGDSMSKKTDRVYIIRNRLVKLEQEIEREYKKQLGPVNAHAKILKLETRYALWAKRLGQAFEQRARIILKIKESK
jgi:hypothetical protein